jgi:hypothetical protein
MIATVVRLRVRGVRVKRDGAALAVGDLQVAEMTASAFGRAVTVARLLHAVRPMAVPELLPPLFDVKLLKMTKDRLILSGIECETVDGQLTDYAQTWLAEIAGGSTK